MTNWIDNDRDVPKQCLSCGLVYRHINSDGLCFGCSQSDEYTFKIVKDYIKQNPKITIAKVSKELNIKVSVLHKFLEEGRLEITEDSKGTYILKHDLWD